ncbi:MAG: AAA-like domain-containing protein [Fimbriimonas sp.]|nr:AAA-like domain-containing protein [Fimbriimonas sp.]
MTRSYFSAGGTLSGTDSSYIAREADEQLYQSLIAGQYCFLLNSRQMGKSSLSVRMLNRLKANGVACVLLDLTRIGGKNVTPEQWYATLCRELGFALGIRDDLRTFWKEHTSLSPMRRFFLFLHDVVLESIPGPVVIFLDEVDATLNLNFSADEFFAGIREFFNRRVEDPDLRRLTFCLVGVALPGDLIRDVRLTPFNIGERIALHDFTAAEVSRYADRLGTNGDALVRQIHYWTRGHPFLTQSLCAAVLGDPGITNAAGVDRLVQRELLEPAARETNINLADVANRVLNATDREEVRSETLMTYERILRGKVVADDESNRFCALLKLSGIVRSERGQLKVRNQIYCRAFDRRWLRTNLPHQEVRRQRTAYVRGLLLAGGLASVIVGSIVALAVDSRLEAHRADQNAAEAAKELKKAVASENDAIAAEQRANEKERAARAAENRAVGLLSERDRALGEAKRLLGERDKALKSAQTAATSERTARKESDRFSFQAYSVAVRNTYMDLLQGREGAALRALFELEQQPQRGWELTYVAQQCHQIGSYFPASNVRVTSLKYWKPHRLVTLSVDGMLTVWDTQTLRPVHRCAVPPTFRSIEIPEKGDDALLIGRTGELARMSLTSGRFLWQRNGLLPSLAGSSLSRDGRTLLIYAGFPFGKIVVCDARQGKVLGMRDLGHTNLLGGDCSSDGSMVVVSGDTASEPKSAFTFVFRTNPMRRILARRDEFLDEPISVAFNPDASSLVVGRRSGVLSKIDLRTMRSRDIPTNVSFLRTNEVQSLGNGAGWALALLRKVENGMSGGLAFLSSESHPSLIHRHVDQDTWTSGVSPDGAEVASTGSDGGVYLWHAPSGKDQFGSQIATLATKGLRPEHQVFSPDAHFVTSSTGEASSPQERLHLFRASDGKELWSLTSPIWNVLFSPDSRLVAYSFEQTGAHLYDVESGRLLRTLNVWAVLGFSADSRRIIASRHTSQGEKVEIYEVGSGKKVLEAPVSREAITAATFSPDGKTIACSGEDHVVRILDAKTGRILHAMYGHTNDPMTMSFTSDGRRLITAGFDNTARIWDTVLGKPIRVLDNSNFPKPGILQARLLPDGHRLVVTSIGPANIWDIDTGRLLLQIPREPDQSSIAILPSGDLLSVGGSGHIYKMEQEITRR